MRLLLLALVFCIASTVCFYFQSTHSTDFAKFSSVEFKNASEALTKHTQEFFKDGKSPFIYTVSERIHVAIGFGLANSILVIGDDGYIIIDTMESVQPAKAVKAEFDKLTNGLPLKAIIYTHNHQDHVYGAKAFLEGEENVQIWSHASTLKYLNRALSLTSVVEYTRGFRQFGANLPESQKVNSGIGLFLAANSKTTPGAVQPTHTFSGDKIDISIAGLELTLLHAPGETDDQIVIWYEKEKVLFAADNFYRAFPNLYAIRGTPARDTKKWVASLDLMRNLKSEIIVPSHTKPLFGKEFIYNTLTAYRDAVQIVHDQTVRYLNLGYSVDEIVQKVHLPEHLRTNEFLIEFYGTVEWSVRGIVTFYVGFFSGLPVHLFPLSPSEHAKEFIEFGGGFDAVVRKAEQAIAEDRLQWALECIHNLYNMDSTNEHVRDLYINVLRLKAATQVSANGRNYYLSYAHELETLQSIRPTMKQLGDSVKLLSIDLIFETLVTILDSKESENVDSVIHYKFTDSGKLMNLHICRGVARLNVDHDLEPDVVVEMTENTYRELVSQKRSPVLALASGDIVVSKGSAVTFGALMKLFKSSVDA